MSASRNLGIRHARADYIALLDADDFWLPTMLETQSHWMNLHPELGMVGSPLRYWHSWTGRVEDENRDYTSEFEVEPDSVIEPPTLLTRFYPLGKSTPIGPSSLLVRRAALEEVGGFEERFEGVKQLYEDQAFLIKMYLRWPVLILSESLILYRVHPDSCCARVLGAGHYDTVRSFFLNWMRRYLKRMGVEDDEVWRALREARRPYRFRHVLSPLRRMGFLKDPSR